MTRVAYAAKHVRSSSNQRSGTAGKYLGGYRQSRDKPLKRDGAEPGQTGSDRVKLGHKGEPWS